MILHQKEVQKPMKVITPKLITAATLITSLFTAAILITYENGSYESMNSIDEYADWSPDLSLTDGCLPSNFQEGDFSREYQLPFRQEGSQNDHFLFPLETTNQDTSKETGTKKEDQTNQPSTAQTTTGQSYTPQAYTPQTLQPAIPMQQIQGLQTQGLQTQEQQKQGLQTQGLQTQGLQNQGQVQVQQAQGQQIQGQQGQAPTGGSPLKSQGALNTTQGGNQPGQTTPQAAPSNPILINFNNVSMIEFIRFISRISNKNFIFNDADLDFSVTIVSEEPATVENIMAVLMQVLRVHGLSLNEQGNNILVHNNKAVTGISEVVAEGLPYTNKQRDSELITQVFGLNTLDAEKAAAIIQPLISEGALVEGLKETNQVIVTDIAVNVSKIGLLIKSLDAPNSGLILGQYVVINALLDSLINLAERVMEPIAEGKPIVFVAHAPSNSVFVVSTPFLVDRALAVLRNLDINIGVTRIFSGDSLRFGGTSQELQNRAGGGVGPGGNEPGQGGTEGSLGGLFGPGGIGGLPYGTLESRSPWSSDLPAGHIERTKFYIHKLRYRKGDQLVDALGRVGLSLQETGAGNLDLVATIQSIQWLEASNSLVFTGTIDAVAKVKELIEEIDTPLRQVFIEMLIINTTLDDSLTYSVNFGSRFDTHNSTFGTQAFLTQTAPLAAALDTAVPNSAVNITGLARQQGYQLGIIGRNVSHGGLSFDTVAALVSAFHDKDKIEIIMNPKLLVEDNQTAEIFVGINTAFQISSITNDFGQIITNNFEFRDVGTLLRVTPLISNNDIVTLDIREEVSSVTTTPTVNSSLSNISPGPTTNISRTVTKVHVPNKYFLVMSGMIQDSYERRRKQVPCLGGAPLIGALFSDKNLIDAKRNLMIFIRPQIVDSVDDIDNLTRHEQDIYRNKCRSKKMWKYEVEEALDLLNIKCPDVSLHDDEQFNP